MQNGNTHLLPTVFALGISLVFNGCKPAVNTQPEKTEQPEKAKQPEETEQPEDTAKINMLLALQF